MIVKNIWKSDQFQYSKGIYIYFYIKDVASCLSSLKNFFLILGVQLSRVLLAMIMQRCLIADYLPNQFVIYTEVWGEIHTVPVTFLFWQCLVDTFSWSHGAVKVTFQHWAQHENSKQGPLHGRGHISVTLNRNLTCKEYFKGFSIFIFPLIWTTRCNSWWSVLPCLLKMFF